MPTKQRSPLDEGYKLGTSLTATKEIVAAYKEKQDFNKVADKEMSTMKARALDLQEQDQAHWKQLFEAMKSEVPELKKARYEDFNLTIDPRTQTLYYQRKGNDDFSSMMTRMLKEKMGVDLEGQSVH